VRNRLLKYFLPLFLIGLFIFQSDYFVNVIRIDADNPSQFLSVSSSAEAIALTDLPKSLRLTQIDGELEVDSEGNLIISGQIKNIFDYFLMTLGEEELDEILLRINAHLSSQLKEPALSQAKTVLTQYIDYKSHMVALNESYSDQADLLGGEFEKLQRQLDMQARLRREVMDPDIVQAFFEFDEEYDQWSLDRLKIGADETLSIDERNQLLSQMDKQLPEDVRLLKEGKYQPQEFRQLQGTQTFASEEEKYTFYQQELGEEAAQRLQRLDETRQQWQARLDDYFTQKQSILSVEGLDQSDKNTAVIDLKESLFSENEQRRLIALEQMKNTARN